MNKDEKRNFSRIVLNAPVFISQNDGAWESNLLDISLNGILVEKPEDWQIDDQGLFELEINLSESDVQICMRGKIAHTEESVIGFQCLHIDFDSICRLKKLVLLNLGSESVLERELSALAA